jgi:AcrR family transcriptional regulator
MKSSFFSRGCLAVGQPHSPLQSTTPEYHSLRPLWQVAPEHYSGFMDIRDRVLQTALECFDELGYDRTSVARIRERSGVSNGALFHHFPNKEAIADALYLEAMRSVQRDYWAALRGEPGTLREGVADLIRNMLAWVETNPRWARFLYAKGHLDWSNAAGAELRAFNQELSTAYREWLGRFINAGQVRDLNMTIVVAVVTGPAHAIAQRWLAGQIRGPLVSYADDLVDAAVAGLSGTPSPRRRVARKVPAEARVRIQCVSDDGAVVCEGHAIAELAPVTSNRGGV